MLGEGVQVLLNQVLPELHFDPGHVVNLASFQGLVFHPVRVYEIVSLFLGSWKDAERVQERFRKVSLFVVP